MATQSLPDVRQQLIDPAILDDLAADVVRNANPAIEDRPKVFSAFTAATVVLISPPLENLAQAYRNACRTPCGRDAARMFLFNMLEADA